MALETTSLSWSYNPPFCACLTPTPPWTKVPNVTCGVMTPEGLGSWCIHRILHEQVCCADPLWQWKWVRKQFLHDPVCKRPKAFISFHDRSTPTCNTWNKLFHRSDDARVTNSIHFFSLNSSKKTILHYKKLVRSPRISQNTCGQKVFPFPAVID